MTVLPAAPSAVIHGVRQSVHRRRLIVARNDDRRALVRLQIFHHGRNKLLILRIQVAGACARQLPVPLRSHAPTALTSEARTGRRWSALPLVLVGVL